MKAMKKILLVMLCLPAIVYGFTTGYKNNGYTGKPDMVTDGVTTSEVSGLSSGYVHQPHFNGYSAARAAEIAALRSAAYQPTTAFDPIGAAAAVKDTTTKTGILKGASGIISGGAGYSDLASGAPTASSFVLGLVKPDGTSVLNTAGAISVTPASIGSPTGSGTSTGTNTGDQTITLSGDATGSGTTAITVNVGKINGDVVDSAARSTGDFLRYDGSQWRHVALVLGDIPNTSSAGGVSKILMTDASGNLGLGVAPTSFLDIYRAGATPGASVFRAYGDYGQILVGTGATPVAYLDSDTINFRQSAHTGNASMGSLSLSGLTITGTVTASGFAGNASTSTKLATGRTLAITGPITYTSPSFDGSGNVTAAATVTAQAGTGSTFVMDTSPTIITPNIATGMTIAGTTQLKGYKEGTWVPTAVNLTVVGTPTLTGTYTRFGRGVNISLKVVAATTTASTKNSTNFTGLPYVPGTPATCGASDDSVNSYGDGTVFTSSKIYTPTWAAYAGTVYVNCFYETTDAF